MRVAMHFCHTRVTPQLNVGCFLNLVDQILRHRGGEPFPAHENNHPVSVLGKIHRSLTGGVRTADHVNDLTLARESFGRSTAVVNSSTLQSIDTRGIEAAPLDSR